MKKWLIYCFGCVILLLTITSCGGTSSSPASAPYTIPSLVMLAPNSYPVESVAVTAYLQINNTTNASISGLTFNIESNTTTVPLSVNNSSSNPCYTIAAQSSCVFPVTIAANPQAGSFTVNVATPQIPSINLSATVGVIDLAQITASGADGISFLYNPSIIANASGTTQIILTAVVNSPNAFNNGPFNTINVTDVNGNLLNFSVLSNNSGAGAGNLSQNSIVTILLNLPSRISTFNFYSQLAQTTVNSSSILDNSINNKLTAIKATTSTVISQGVIPHQISVFPASSNVGILANNPNQFNLTTSIQSKIISYTNTGNTTISALNIVTVSPLTAGATTCGTTLTAGASCTYVVNFDSSQSLVGTATVTATYNNGQSNGQTSVTNISYNGVAPTVILTTPQSSGQFTGIGTPITVTFSSPVITSTVTNSTFTVGTTPGGSDVVGKPIIFSSDSKSATFTPRTSLSMYTTYYVTITSGVLSSSSVPMTPYSASFLTQQQAYNIFIATNSGNGWTANLGGVSGADAKCQADSQCGTGQTCTAMIVDQAGNRIAAPTTKNWVLQPYTDYQNMIGQDVGITGITPILYLKAAANSQTFSFPLKNSFQPTSNILTWTGMNTDWTTSINTCEDWTTDVNNPFESGNIGYPIFGTSYAINFTYAECALPLTGLACVEQPLIANIATMTTPTPRSESAGIQTPIVVKFSNPIDPATVDDTTFIVSTIIGGSQVTAASITVSGDNESATFVPSSPLSANTEYLVTLTGGVTSAVGQPVFAPYHTFFATEPPLTIFIANNESNGWPGNLFESALAAGANVTNGVEAADYFCQNDPRCEDGWTCKAMIVESGVRSAVPPQDWVLQANKEYQNISGGVIGVTGYNPVGFAESAPNSQTFAFPLNAPFATVFPLNLIWTGLNADWTTDTADTCSGWNANNGYGYNGNLNNIDVHSISYNFSGCSNLYLALACVQQAPQP